MPDTSLQLYLWRDSGYRFAPYLGIAGTGNAVYLVRFKASRMEDTLRMDNNNMTHVDSDMVIFRNDILCIFRDKKLANQYANDYFYEKIREEFKSKRYVNALINGYIREKEQESNSLSIPTMIKRIFTGYLHDDILRDQICHSTGLFSADYRCDSRKMEKIEVEVEESVLF